MAGWFAVSRDLLDHPIFRGNPERVYVWLWMIQTAAYSDCRMDANGTTVTVKRGQLLTSYRQISKATGVGVQVIRTLLARLKDQHATQHETNTGRLLITICNYDKYQAPLSQANTRATHAQHTKKQYNNIPVGTDEKSSVSDPVKIMFDSGVSLLSEAGISGPKARALLGKWRKDHGVPNVIEALGKAQREGAIDPVSFIEGCFRYASKKPAQDALAQAKRMID